MKISDLKLGDKIAVKALRADDIACTAENCGVCKSEKESVFVCAEINSARVIVVCERGWTATAVSSNHKETLLKIESDKKWLHRHYRVIPISNVIRLIGSVSKEYDGMNCVKCKAFTPMAQPNEGDIFRCYECRKPRW